MRLIKLRLEVIVRAFVSVVALAAAATLTFFGAHAAVALPSQPLPEGNVLYAFDCESAPFGEFVNVNVSDFSATLVGTNVSTAHASCAEQAAFNPVTSEIFWISLFGSNESWLMKADLQTGSSTEMGRMTLNTVGKTITALAIGADGRAFAIGYDTQVQGSVLYSVDLSTAALTSVANLDPTLITGNVYSFAYNPKTREFYLQSGNAVVRQIDVSTGLTTVACTYAAQTTMYGFSFDQNGLAWTTYMAFYLSTRGGGYIDVSSPTCEPRIVGTLNIGGTTWYSESPVVSYPVSTDPIDPVDPDGTVTRELAKTGVAGNEWMWSISIAAFLLLLGGTMLVVRRPSGASE